MSADLKCLDYERLLAVVEDQPEEAIAEITRVWDADGDLRDFVHQAAVVVAKQSRAKKACPHCMILLNGLLWGIRLERKRNEERALEALAGGDFAERVKRALARPQFPVWLEYVGRRKSYGVAMLPLDHFAVYRDLVFAEGDYPPEGDYDLYRVVRV